MNKKITISIMAALMITGLTSIKTFAAMDNGSVVIGNNAFDLGYANDQINSGKITAAIVEGGKVYVKDFSGNWIDNFTGLSVNASIIPAVTYRNYSGTSSYDLGDKTHALLLIKSVSTVSSKNVLYGITASNVGLPITITLKLSDNTTRNVSVTWTSSTYNGTKPATYKFTGAYALPSGKIGRAHV